MPWNETTRMDERRQFVRAFRSGAYTMSELCRLAGVSRPTGYLWVQRDLEQGEAGLHDRSHAPHECPHRTAQALREAVLELRRTHPSWGPRKLLARAQRLRPNEPWPARSTVAEWLSREGRVVKRVRRGSGLPRAPGQSARTPSEPNGLWTIDFKGEFRTGDRRYCYPLTVADLASRYLLALQGQRGPDGAPVTACTDALFREHGLPEAIHCDGGSPFTGRGLGGYSHVSLRRLRTSRHRLPGALRTASHQPRRRVQVAQSRSVPWQCLRRRTARVRGNRRRCLVGILCSASARQVRRALRTSDRGPGVKDHAGLICKGSCRQNLVGSGSRLCRRGGAAAF